MLVGEIITKQVIKSINNCIAKMGFGCLSHPGASTIGSQLLDVPMAGKSWQPSHEPPRSRRSRHHHTVETVERGRKRGGKVTAWVMSCHTAKTSENASCTFATLRTMSMWNSDTCTCVDTADYQGNPSTLC